MTARIKEHLCDARRLPRSDAIIMGRAELLDTKDRDLIHAVFLHGQPVSAVARMMGLSPRAVRGRLHRLSRRLTSQRFLQAARAIDHLDPEDAHIAKRWFCQRATQKQIARELGLTRHALRRRLDRIWAQIALLARQRRVRRSSAPPRGRTVAAL
jgi:hypothetical protein